MKLHLIALSFIALIAGMPNVAHADLNDFIQSVNRQALKDIKEFNERLSRQFGIPVPDVEAIVNSVPKPADAFMILQIGQMAHLPPDAVLQRYRSNPGKAWGSLAQEMGIKPGSREFHALKRGQLSLAGQREAPSMRQGGKMGKEHGGDHGKGKGRQKD